jgi:signal peptidase I
MLKNVEKIINSALYKWSIIAYVIFVLVVIFFSVDIFSPFHSFTNKSDSMSPAITTGSITIVKSFPNYAIGDAIAYYANSNGVEEIVTHRIMDIGGNVYTTKGDANAVADRELVRPRLVIGKVVYVIPFLGHILTLAKGPVGTWLTIIGPAIIIISAELIRITLELERNKRREDESIQIS